MPPILKSDQTVLLLIDVQTRFMPVLPQAETLTARCRLLIEGCTLLDVPIIITEQYPAGLGPTIPELRDVLPPDTPIIAKRSFSAMGETTFVKALQQTQRQSIILCGVEAHVCIQQTAMALLTGGYTVHLAEDAIRARHPQHVEIALRKLYALGAMPSSVEMALFELAQTADHPQFKAMQQLVIASSPSRHHSFQR